MSDIFKVHIEKEEGFEQDLKAYDMIEKTAADGGNSARVFVPNTWTGKLVRVFLLEQPAEKPARKKSKD